MKYLNGAVLLAALAAATLWTGTATAASTSAGATITVTATTDGVVPNGNCTLREAIQAAETNKAVDKCTAGNGTDTIVLKAGVYKLTQGALDLNTAIVLKGVGAATIIDGAGNDLFTPAIFVRTSGNLTASRLTVRGADGSGLINFHVLSLTDVTVSGNGADEIGCPHAFAGGIENDGVLQIATSTIANNSGNQAGGILNDGGTVIAVNSTIVGNYASVGCDSGNPSDGAGGINNAAGKFTGRNLTITGNKYDETGTTSPGPQAGGFLNETSDVVRLANSVIAGNTNNEVAAPDCNGKITSLGYNLVQSTTGCTIIGTVTGNITGKSPKLGPLANNGGNTQTQQPLAGSPLVDKANPAAPGVGVALCPLFDQRSIARPRDGNGDHVKRCDIGALEK